ncbi:MAG: UDP-N-acetylmuramate dehydrogenase [Oscillospiraceae bacterium]|nr:UDP-N-acetylmuramate dehydrogenase [Oscillospiraceae bacterium]
MRFNALNRALLQACPGLPLRADEPMAAHTSLRIGGPAALMAFPRSPEELRLCRSLAADRGIPVLLMGNGTNLLAPDEGLAALVLCTTGMTELERTGETEITADCGVPLARLSKFAQVQGLDGLAFAHGIPGSVGGAVYMNAGAYGGEMKDVVDRTVYLDREGELCILSGSEHGFSYRRSVFFDNSGTVLRVRFRLTPGDPKAIEARMTEFAAKRRVSQPLEFPNAGSTFKRPQGYFAAALIDQCGLKGLSVGGAQVSEKHAGFLINRGGATCADMLKLMDLVRDVVQRETGILLEPEIRIL